MPDISGDTTTAWRTALSNAYKYRVDPDQLDDAFTSLSKRDEAPSRLIIETLLRAAPRAPYDKDPLITRYLDLLLQRRLISPGELLIGVLHNSAFSKQGSESSVVTASTGLPTFEEKVFLMLKNHVHGAHYFSDPSRVRDLVLGLTRWLNTISTLEITRQVELGPVHVVSASAASMYETLGLLAYTIFNQKEIFTIEKQSWWKQKRSILVEELDKFDVNVLQVINSQLTGYLRNLTVQRPFLGTDAKGRPTFTLAQILTTFPAMPTVNTRAGLFIWLSTCLDSRPLTDEATMRNHILVRYQDNAQNAIVSLILASFDTLARPQSEGSKVDSPRLIKSFICNKLPLLLVSCSSLMSVLDLENCISMALLSLSLDPTGQEYELMHQTQQSFLRACMLHSLVSQNSVTSIMSELADMSNIGTKYHRANLVAQCSANTTRLDSLINELDSLDGNAGAIAGCIVDLTNAWCASKDFMALKDLSTTLLRRVSFMDIVLQYTQPAELMLPVCQLLNDWTPEQEHSEFQPPYEDFAGIYLFVSVLVHRYGFSRSELGVTSTESFLGRVLTNGSSSLSMNDLTEKQNTQLALWVQGLYATDEGGEIVGISDEVYSTCPPQAFYILVPTILEQTMLACKAKALSPAIMKAGLEFLLEPFLLPSLISGLRWAATSAWKDTEETAIRLQILEKLIKPVNTSQDAQVMHKAALAIAAPEVEQALQQLLRTTSQKKKEINALLTLLRPHCEQTDMSARLRSGATFGDSKTISDQLRTCVQSLTAWTSSSTIKPPPSFSGRLMSYCVQALDATRTINCLVEETAKHLEDSIGAAMIDIVSALISAPNPEHYTPVATTMISPHGGNPLMRSLRMATANTDALLSMPPKRAEALIRLQKSVEAQSTISPLASQLAMVSMALPTQSATDQVMQDLALDASDGALAAAVGLPDGAGIGSDVANTQVLEDLLGDPNKLLGLGSTDGIFDFKIGSADDNALLTFDSSLNPGETDGTTNPEDDIFGDLDMTDLGGGYDFT